MLTEEDFNNFCITKGLLNETVSIKNHDNLIVVTIKVRNKTSTSSKNYSAVAETSADAFAAVRKLAFDDIEQTFTMTTDPIDYLERERADSNLSYKITYTKNVEGYWGEIELTINGSSISLPFEAPNYAKVHQCAAEKAQNYLSTIK
jgi:hypothetical protein